MHKIKEARLRKLKLYVACKMIKKQEKQIRRICNLGNFHIFYHTYSVKVNRLIGNAFASMYLIFSINY